MVDMMDSSLELYGSNLAKLYFSEAFNLYAS